MLKSILLTLLAIVSIFSIYVASRPSDFKYERSGFIQAPAEKIFPYLNNFKLGEEWTPFGKNDPTMKTTFSGPNSGVGSGLSFEGNAQTGEGKLEIIRVEPNTLVEIRLDMIKPLEGHNIVQYRLTPEGAGTRFTWTMSGKGTFLTKAIGVFIDCDKMMGKVFDQGIQSLKQKIESLPK